MEAVTLRFQIYRLIAILPLLLFTSCDPVPSVDVLAEIERDFIDHRDEYGALHDMFVEDGLARLQLDDTFGWEVCTPHGRAAPPVPTVRLLTQRPSSCQPIQSTALFASKQWYTGVCSESSKATGPWAGYRWRW